MLQNVLFIMENSSNCYVFDLLKDIRILITWITPGKFTDTDRNVKHQLKLDLILRHHLSQKKRAATCDFQQCGILTCVDADEPVQPSVELRNSN